VFRGNTALKDTHDTMALLAEEHKGPTVAHATGFSMEDGREHDAGYDAYLTACAFAHMLAILPDAPASPDAAVSPPRLRVLPEALLVPSSPFAVRYLNKVRPCFCFAALTAAKDAQVCTEGPCRSPDAHHRGRSRDAASCVGLSQSNASVPLVLLPAETERW